MKIASIFVLSIAMMAFCATLGSAMVPFSTYGNWTVDMNDDYTPIPYKTGYYETALDHFNFEVAGSFKMRYLYNDDYFVNSAEKPGPIFIYCGNEAPIDLFWPSAGFWTNVMTQKHNAMIMFLEHRYFGESLPFGKDSNVGKNIQYLSTEQALADYGLFLRKFKKERGLENSPIIVFGGSYGGMLAAWFRMKYPQVVDGAVASSAPLLMFENIASPYAYWEIVTNDYTNAGCGGILREGFQLMHSLLNRTETYDMLTDNLNLCDPITGPDGILGIYDYVKFSLGTMAQFDYPYPTLFDGPMPASPVTVACQKLLAALDFDTPPVETTNFLEEKPEINMKLLKGMFEAANVYNDPYGKNTCNRATPPSGTNGHDGPSDYLACTGCFPVGSNGVTDFLWDQPWDYESYAAECVKKWGLQMRPDWMPEHYGGFNYQRDFAMYSNIVFSQGSLDPWHKGGVSKNIVGAKDMIGFMMEGAAHHLDLRYPSLADPAQVVRGRQTEDFYVTKWIREAIERNLSERD